MQIFKSIINPISISFENIYLVSLNIQLWLQLLESSPCNLISLSIADKVYERERIGGELPATASHQPLHRPHYLGR